MTKEKLMMLSKHLFNDMMRQHCMVKSFFEERTYGVLETDNEEDPQTAVVWNGLKRFYFAGKPHNKAFEKQFKYFFSEIYDELIVNKIPFVNFFYPDEEWREYVENHLLNEKQLMFAKRRLYKFKKLKHDWRNELPLDYQIKEITDNLLQHNYLSHLDELKEEILSESINYSSFFENCFGYVIIDNEEIAARIVSEYNCTNHCELGIETNENYRRNSLGLTLGSYFVEKAISNGYERIFWHAWETNDPSWKLAEKIGFILADRYTSAYMFTDELINLRAAANHFLYFRKNFEKAAELFEQTLKTAEKQNWKSIFDDNITKSWFYVDWAKALAGLSDFENAVEKLKKAVEEGIDLKEEIYHDGVFKELRESELFLNNFSDIMKKITGDKQLYKITENLISLKPLFKNLSNYHMLVNSVLENLTEGEVFTDDLNNPKSAVIFINYGEGDIYFGGKTSNKGFNIEIRELMKKKMKSEADEDYHNFTFYLNDIAERDNYPALFDDLEMWEMCRVYMEFEGFKEDLTVNIPKEFEIYTIREVLEKKIDYKYYCEVEDWVDLENQNTKEISDLDYGICIVDEKDKSVVSLSQIDFIVGSDVEIGVKTMPEYRKKGLGSASVYLNIKHLIKNGYEKIGWHYWSNNPASGKTAEKCGFVKILEHPVLYREFNEFENFYFKGWTYLAYPMYIDYFKSAEAFLRTINLMEKNHESYRNSEFMKESGIPVSEIYYSAGKALLLADRKSEGIKYLKKSFDLGISSERAEGDELIKDLIKDVL